MLQPRQHDFLHHSQAAEPAASKLIETCEPRINEMRKQLEDLDGETWLSLKGRV